MNIEKISNNLRDEKLVLSLDELTLFHNWLSGEYAFISARLEEILKIKPSTWNNLREHYKSDKQCDRAWDATIQGLDEQGYRLRLKTIEKLLSSIKLRTEILRGEAKSYY